LNHFGSNHDEGLRDLLKPFRCDYFPCGGFHGGNVELEHRNPVKYCSGVLLKKAISGGEGSLKLDLQEVPGGGCPVGCPAQVPGVHAWGCWVTGKKPGGLKRHKGFKQFTGVCRQAKNNPSKNHSGTQTNGATKK